MREENIQNNDVEKVYQSIKEIFLSYSDELEEAKKSLEKITIDMKEVEEYIARMESKHHEDVFVFSPRSSTPDVQDKKDELAILFENKKMLEINISKLESKLAIFESNKNILKEITLQTSALEEEKKKAEEELSEKRSKLIAERENLRKIMEDNCMEKLSYISHMIDMINTYIDSDPVRAKLELKNIKKKVESVVNDLENSLKEEK